MRSRTWAKLTAIATAIGLAAAILAVAPAAASSQPTTQSCESTGSMAMYSDEARTALVDVVRWVDAPTQRLYLDDRHYMSMYVMGDGQRPGVPATGLVTGDAYNVQFSSRSHVTRPESGGQAQVSIQEWRVMSQDGGGVAGFTHNQSGRVIVDGDRVVERFFMSQHGLWISGGNSTRCD